MYYEIVFCKFNISPPGKSLPFYPNLCENCLEDNAILGLVAICIEILKCAS